MSSVQALSASPGRGRHPHPPWQWVLSGRLPACDLTFPTCKRKVKSPARNASAGPQAQSQRSGMAVSFLSRTSNTSSISGILSLANNRTSYLTGTQVGPFTRLEVREPELGREEVSTLLPSSTGFGLRGSDVLCQLLNSAVTTRAQTDRVWVKARAAFRPTQPSARTDGGLRAADPWSEGQLQPRRLPSRPHRVVCAGAVSWGSARHSCPHVPEHGGGARRTGRRLPLPAPPAQGGRRLREAAAAVLEAAAGEAGKGLVGSLLGRTRRGTRGHGGGVCGQRPRPHRALPGLGLHSALGRGQSLLGQLPGRVRWGFGSRWRPEWEGGHTTDLTPAVTTEMEAWVHTRTCGHVPWLSRRQTGSSPAVRPPPDASGPATCSHPYCRALPSLRAGVTPR